MSELPNLSLFPPGHETVSQKDYLIKEKKRMSFNGHLNLGITSSTTTTTTSIVLEEKKEDMKEKSQTMKVKSMDLFPQNSGFGPRSTSVSVPKEDDDDIMIISSKQQQQQQADDDFRSVKLEPESSTAPMTIFYGGKVLVFNHISVPKAKQIFNFAAATTNNNTPNAISSSSPHSATPMPPPPNTTANNNINNNINNSSGTVIPSVISATSNLAPATETTAAAAAAAAAGNPGMMMMMMINSKQQNFKASKLSDLPIQRKASLHRFLEKRKDRINARAPYNNNHVNSSKSTESVADKVMHAEGGGQGGKA